MSISICGVVILYNPNIDKVIQNISSYLDEIELLYVIDNSIKDNSIFFVYNKKIKYIFNYENLGISKALNIACKLAVERKFKWILTMDQDSSFKQGDLNKMIDLSKNVSEDVFIISPEYLPYQLKEIPEFEYAKWAITSGQLLNLKFFKKLGLFNEDYFIDQVDFEYSLRGRRAGFKIIKSNLIILNHELGYPQQIKIPFLKKRITTSNHNALRKYYFIRNFLYLKQEYKKNFPQLFKEESYMLFKIILKTIFLEKDKKNKINMMLKGYFDFKRGVKGKYVEK
ncbi:glycosyltransferase [Apibacter adventoris]|uniref:Glycosyl transferase n=1 Tax=Apibacter adventoris TaxID=1679466 RepID=A0A2S8AGX1_9FLAO|nr:glycosyltransferase [Apibacter adventoris]PQL95492.1 glycosyl transferase [Apibacter adventoris]